MLGQETVPHASSVIQLLRLMARLNDTCSAHGVQKTKRAVPQPDNIPLIETDNYDLYV
jgi:hypothetical protein